MALEEEKMIMMIVVEVSHPEYRFFKTKLKMCCSFREPNPPAALSFKKELSVYNLLNETYAHPEVIIKIEKYFLLES